MKPVRGSGSIFVMSGPWEQRKPEDILWIKYWKYGKPHRESTRSNKLWKARQLLKKRLTAAENDPFADSKARRVKVDDLISDLLKWYRNQRNKPVYATASERKWETHLKKFFGGMPAALVTTDKLTEYQNQRLDYDSRPTLTTINREFAVLRKAFKRAAAATPPKVAFVPQFPLASEKENARKVFIIEEDKQKLRDAASTDVARKDARMKGIHLKCFVELLFVFGWRKGELTGLRVSNVNLREGFIRIEASKNGEPREVPLTPNLKVLLEAIIAGKSKNESLFPAKEMRHAWKRLCKRAGLKPGLDGYVIHDTRRTAARTKRSAGVSETVTSTIMGWKPGSKMFARYGIVDRNDMREALERTEQHEQVLRESQNERAEFGQNQAKTAPETVQSATASHLPN